MMLKLRLFLTALLIISVTEVFGQISFDSKEELEKAANELFDSKNYEKAKPLFSQLLSLNALEPNYNYQFGVCVLYTEADPLKPLPYIEGGASTTGVNPEAFYFLGKAYQYNYRFDDAIVHYEKAKKTGYSNSGVDIEKSIQECRSGKLLFNSKIEFEPAQNKEVIEAEFYRPYDFRKLKGKVIPMPANFKTKYDQKNLLGTFVYTPSNSQTLFYASYGEDGANAKDLYRVNRLPNGEWSLPQRLPNTVNTKYDEDYAFFDDEANTLYFASKGHNTMGGYDVFRSVYNSEKNEWSQPINLQFPINSPYDDFLYVSDPDGKVAFFTSKRETEVGKIRVFKTLLHDPSRVELSIIEGTYEDKTDSIYNYMLATVIDSKTNEVLGKYRSNKETGKYVLVLPPQNDYSMDVGPREAAGFKFDLDVPQHEPTNPLQQALTFDTESGDGTVTLTNYFNATGKPDSVAVAMKRPKAEVESAMVVMPDPSEILAARQKARDEVKRAEQEKLAQLAAAEEAKFAAEKAKQDSLIAVKKAAIEAEAARLKAEAARKDSIAQAEFALKKIREKAIQDSLEMVRAKDLLAQRERAVADSLALVAERELFAIQEREKFIADSLAKEEELAVQLARERERIIADSIAMAEERELFAIQEHEKFIADSLANAEDLALQIAKEEAKVDSLEAVALKAEQDSLAEATKRAELAMKEKVIADSLTAAEERAAQLAMEDSLKKVEAERERLDQIEREIEEVKAKALRDSVVEMDVASVTKNETTEKEEESFEEILREMQEKEAEILAESRKSSAKESESVTVASQSTPETDLKDSLAAEEVISEADLFLQTIAKLEEQKKLQEKAVEEENARLTAEKEERERLAGLREDSIKSVMTESGTIAASGDSLAQEIEPIVVEGEKDLEEESLALKSDADPNEYLEALAEIEAEMAKDAVSNNKSYELKDLGNQVAESNKEVDPVLEAKIAADRKVLEEHRRIAEEKEAALKEQMQRDIDSFNDVVVFEEGEEEFVGVESDAVARIDQPEKAGQTQTVSRKLKSVKVAESKVVDVDSSEKDMLKSSAQEIEDNVNQYESERVYSMEDSVELEPIQREETESSALEETKESVVETMEELELVSEADGLMEEVITEQGVVNTSENDEEGEAEPSTSSLDEFMVESKETEEPIAPDVQQLATDIEKHVEVNEIAVEETSDLSESAPVGFTEEEVVVTKEMVGKIPFLTSAMRDYSKRKPNFSGISNPSMKRMVQRMRAEDVGRLAVLKNMKNQWVDEGKTQESLNKIKSNNRNQDVLATVAKQSAIEEKTRQPFDRNDLRERQQVTYKLTVQLTSDEVSEAIAGALTPQQSMTFAMPDLQLESGYYTTLADVRSDLRYYNRRGFGSVKIVAFHQGEQVKLSDVKDIPFVD